MSEVSHRETRERTQEQLTAAQDRWLAAMNEHGNRADHPVVAKARKELDEARRAYLAAFRHQRD